MSSLQAALLALAIGGAEETVLLDFYTDWCGPCRQMEGTLRELQSRGYPVRRVNGDRERELMARFHVDRFPTFVLVVNGREAGRIVGSTSLAELERLFQSAESLAGQPARQVRGQSPDPISDVAPPTRQFPLFEGHTPLSEPSAPDELVAVERPGPKHQPIQSQQSFDSALLAASVRLRIDDGGSHSVGSGTIIDARSGEALVLTCGHIFRDSAGKGPIAIDLFGPGAPQGLPGHLISYDLASDVGLVRFRPTAPVTPARVAPAGYAVRQDDAVINVGCNHGQDPTARASRVTAIDKFLGPPNLVVAGQPVQGRSGGGLFTTQGLVIGVCNAADPADDEGLYAALASIHAELERMGLSQFCLEPVETPEADALLAVEPPSMPNQMPGPAEQRFPEALVPTAGKAEQHRAAGQLTAREAAALAEIGQRGDAEVICIVRPRNKPGARSEIFVLDEASPEFLEQLTNRRQAAPPADRSQTRQPAFSAR